MSACVYFPDFAHFDSWQWYPRRIGGLTLVADEIIPGPKVGYLQTISATKGVMSIL